jgi:hypothetical protein
MKKLVPLLALGALLLVPAISHAANLGFTPASVSRTAGSTFSVAVYVSSADEAMNAASGVVSFPTDKLEVVSLSRTSSVLSLWVQEPTFSNTKGTVNFEGIALNPGYTGNQGTILSITFRAKTTGQANLAFSSGSVLANDGAGTNILENLGTAKISVQAAPPKETSVPAESKETEEEVVVEKEVVMPEKPVITSYEHEVEAGGLVKIEGTATPGVEVEIRFSIAGEAVRQETTSSTASGTFLIATDALSEPGAYTFVAEALDAAGNRSGETSPFTVVVKQKPFDRLPSLTMLLGLILLGITAGALCMWYRSARLLRAARESHRAVLEKSFNQFRKELKEYAVSLRTAQAVRKLSIEELVFLDQFEGRLTEKED